MNDRMAKGQWVGGFKVLEGFHYSARYWGQELIA